MSWKLRPRAGKGDGTLGTYVILFFLGIIGLLIWTQPTLLIIFLMVLFRFIKKNLALQKQPTLLNKQDRIETERKSKERYEEFKNYKGSESYQALLKKYDGNIPGSGQGDRGGEKIGKKGGRYIKRVSKKTGKPYRHYF
tara:strand:+ start:170 stop:586 length:417 start_codon:yes stop_codon:yes gene_type:complete